jgi:hypothetical protein
LSEAHKYWQPAELFPLTVTGVAEAGLKKKKDYYRTYTVPLYRQDLRSTAICGGKNYYFQDIATIHSAVA